MTANMPGAEVEVSSRLVSDLLRLNAVVFLANSADYAEMEAIGRDTLERVLAGL